MTSRADLEALKYRQLQKLAKEAGVKANLPRTALINALATHDLNRTFDTKQSTPKTTATPSAKSAKTSISPVKPASGGRKRSSGKTKKTSKSPVKTVKTPLKSSTPGQKSKNSTPIQTPRFVEFTASPKIATKTATKKPNVFDRLSTPKTVGRPSRPLTPMVAVNKSTRKSVLSIRKSVSQPKDILRARLAGTPGSVTKAKKNSTPTARSTVKKTAEKVKRESGIPRFMAKKAPDFAKLHAQQFERMESLDVYLSKKKERTKVIKERFANAKEIAMQHEEAMQKVKRMTPMDKAPVRRSPRNVENKAPSAFVPSSLTVNESNFKFGTSGGNNGKPFVFTATSPKKTPSKNKILTNITNEPGSGKKGAAGFDLKASLAKPLSYKPYTGKLKDFEDKKKERQAMAAKSKAGSKAAARNMIKGVRMNKRAELLMQKRNLS